MLKLLLLPIACVLAAGTAFLLAWRGGIGLTIVRYTLVLSPRHLIFTGILLLVVGLLGLLRL